MKNKGIWIVFVVLALLIGLYPITYFVIDPKFGLLTTKSNSLLATTWWNIAFYTHIFFGGLALIIGWSQFSERFRNRNLFLHRRIGKIYLLSVMLSSVAAICIGFYATGGIISSAGFISLGLIWFYTTFKAYWHIRKKNIDAHRKAMIYSYAACFAAVTLRIWLPVLQGLVGDFIVAYRIVAWLCWVPNLVVAYLLSKRM